MDKEFTPYQEALALKELGFDEPCFALLFTENKQLIQQIFNDTRPYDKDIFIQAPTFSQAFRFFREKYKLHSTITSISQESWQWHITKPGESLGKLYNEDFYTYEEAELACLRKLIEIVKEKQNG